MTETLVAFGALLALAFARIPIGLAVTFEFIGPLTLAVLGSRRPRDLVWVGLAGLGVLLLGVQPADLNWAGVGFALLAAATWAAYILLTQRVGDQIPGVAGVAVSMPVAGLVASLLVAPGMVGSDVFGSLTWELLLAGLGLAVLLPVVPFTLELLALRRLTTAAFGTLMALEPAFALLVGLVVLHQVPGLMPVLGIVCVVAAGIGAERTGARERSPADLAEAGC